MCLLLSVTITVSNTLAFYATELITAVKSVIIQTLGACHKTFTPVINSVCSKLVSLLLSVTLTVWTNKQALTELITAVKSFMNKPLESVLQNF